MSIAPLKRVIVHRPDEGHAWVNVTYMDDDDFAEAVAEREARTETTDGAGQ